MSFPKDNHVTILFEKENLDTADPTSDFILTTLGAIAQEESRSISENIRWGVQKRYPKGEAQNADIYGYRFMDGEDAYEYTESGYKIRRVEIVEEEAAVVRKIFQSVAVACVEDRISGLEMQGKDGQDRLRSGTPAGMRHRAEFHGNAIPDQA